MINENTIYQNSWNAAEVVLLGIYRFKVCTRKETRLNSNKIKFKLKKLEKEQ